MRKKTVLIALVILALGLVGTGLSALYQQQDWQTTEITTDKYMGTFNVFYGFPLSWHGYAHTTIWYLSHWNPPYNPPKVYWFSLESLLLDVAFWFVISFFVSFVALKSARALNLVARIRAGVLGMKTSIILLVMSLLFIVIGVGLCLVAQSSALESTEVRWYIIPSVDWMAGYLDVGLRLIGSGTVTLIATLSVMLWKPSNVRVRQGYADDPNSHEV